MRKPLKKKVVVVSPDDSIDSVVRSIAEASARVESSGIAVVLDANERALGVLTDGDIRRSHVQGVGWDLPVEKIMSKSPILVSESLAAEEIIEEVFRQAEAADHLRAKYVRHVLVIDTQRRVVDVYDFFKILWEQDHRSERVVIFGLGFVGLTIAVALANAGYRVTGYDPNSQIAERLSEGEPHIYEPGLAETLRQTIREGVLDCVAEHQSLQSSQRTTFIIAVGTPVSKVGLPDLSDVKLACGQVGSLLQEGDQVIVRSTIPVGATRRDLLPLFEGQDNLKAGSDFNLSFCPERTLAGNAMRELVQLPQLVGGLTERCSARAARFWSRMTSSVIQVGSLEAAELAKLANNSFRDLVFAFSNQLIPLADEYNLILGDVIAAANNGYPRNPIPLPSPGVGGYCLTKDPYLLAASLPPQARSMASLAREINEEAATYALIQIERFSQKIKRPTNELTFLIIGISFKGEPETNDTRGSCAVTVSSALRKQGCSVRGWDEVLTPEEIDRLDMQPMPSKLEGMASCDVILIMNNHRRNADLIIRGISAEDRPRLIFDGWGQLNRKDVEKIPRVTYSTLGYLSN